MAQVFIPFPSPFGVRVLKLPSFNTIFAKMADLFPSPFGVRVLKSSACKP